MLYRQLLALGAVVALAPIAPGPRHVRASLKVVVVLPSRGNYSEYGTGASAPAGSKLAIPVYSWHPDTLGSNGRPALQPGSQPRADNWLTQTFVQTLSASDGHPISAQVVLPDVVAPAKALPLEAPTAAYSSDGTTLAVVLTGGRQIEIVRNGSLEPNGIKLAAGETATSIAVSPYGRRIAALERDGAGHGALTVYDGTDQKLQWVHEVSAGIPGHAAFSPDGSALAWTRVQPGTGLLRGDHTPVEGPNLFVSSASTGKVLLKVATNAFADWVCFGPGARIYTAPSEPYGANDKHRESPVLVWDAHNGEQIGALAVPGRSVTGGIALSPDGHYLYADISRPWHMTWYDSNAYDLEIAVWDTRNGEFLAKSGKLDSGRRIYGGVQLSAGPSGVLISDGGSVLGPPLFLRLVTEN